jgi:uncharacterized protein
MKRILVLCGGGAKGEIQIQVLKKLEHDFGSLYKFYDLICGSSVGAINGGIIASGKMPMDVTEFIYPGMLRKVFDRRFGIPLYDRKNFVTVWNDNIGMIKMNECKTKFQATSIDICTKTTHFFKSWEDKDGAEYAVVSVCRSFAAPLYFGQMPDKTTKRVYFDGGMGLSNLPLDYAITEAEMLWPGEQWHFDIVGSGFADQNIAFDKVMKYKVVRQLLQYFNFDDGGLAREMSRQDQVRRLQKRSTKNTNITFRYWDSVIPKEMDTMDGLQYLEDYKLIGIKMAQKPLIQSA